MDLIIVQPIKGCLNEGDGHLHTPTGRSTINQMVPAWCCLILTHGQSEPSQRTGTYTHTHTQRKTHALIIILDQQKNKQFIEI